ncbi:MAG: protein kinase domain-containing protein [Thermoleophilaceae bacterium]
MERPPPTDELEPTTAAMPDAATRGFAREPAPDGFGGELLLERYRLERRLGAGGFGTVWLARDERLERDVAVKVIPRGDADEGSPRAQREATAAARLNHPGIVALYELASDAEHVYLVSELVHGSTFAELLREGALSDRDVANIGAALCEALAHAHSRGVVHRDVKPQNVMVLAEPAAGAGFAKLADFGVAHLADVEPITHTGDVVGTLAYMAPEQAEGVRVSEAADVYSLALTLYEGWAGRNPVRAASPAATARRLGRRVPSLASRRRDLPPELCATIDSALDPDPDRRPPLELLRDELERAERELSDEGGLVEPENIERFGLRRAERPLRLTWPARLAAGLAAGALMAAALALLGPPAPASPAAVAAGCALAVAILPRAGWLAGAAGLLGWLIGEGEPGTALVIAPVLAATPLLLPRSPLLWSVPVLAPLLGAVGLAPAFAALAGFGGRLRRRAALAAAGVVWLVGAEALTGKALLFGPADGTEPRSGWAGSLTGAAEHAVWPAISSPALLAALAFCLLAALVPLAVRARNLTADIVLGAIWAAGLVAALRALDDVMDSHMRLASARGAVAGSLVGAAAAIALSRVWGDRSAPESHHSSLGWPSE